VLPKVLSETFINFKKKTKEKAKLSDRHSFPGGLATLSMTAVAPV
jgi:hypothetical protein